LNSDKVAIEIKNLTYCYKPETPEITALKDINIEVHEGEYLCIMGANGAGKTTLCLHLNGILPVVLGGAMGGEIKIIGEHPYDQHVFDNALHVGMVLQDPEAQLFSSDVMSEVAFAAENRGISREKMLELIDWSLDKVRLMEYKYGSPPDLSGGQKQRLVIASNLVIQPEIMALDEPTSQLDPIGTTEVFATLNELNKDYGMTIVVATHKSNEVVEFADRIAVLEEGKLIALDTPRKVFCDVPRLKHAYVAVPEIAEIDYQLRQFAGDKADVFGPDDCMNIEVDQAIEPIANALDQGILKPNKDYRKGLGRALKRELVSPDAKPILEIKDVDFRYKEDAPLALENISMNVHEGEIVGIIGQNGAGKTTLMKCITGLLKPSAGTIKIKGQDNAEMDAFDIAKLVGLILQHPDNQLFQLSSEEEIAFGLRNLELEEDLVQERIDEALALTGCERYREEYPFNLSMGDRRKLAVASIFAMHPEILIFDEPTTGQDYKGRYQLCDLALTLNERFGATIIMISHDMSLIARYCQRTIIMGKANLLLDAPTRDAFMAADILESTFLSPPPIASLAQKLESHGMPSDILTVEEFLHSATGVEIQNLMEV
jgi:energy-coupling factor transport system ATP-binding protein